MPGGGLARGPAAFSIYLTFFLILYLSRRDIPAAFKIGVTVAYGLCWAFFFVAPRSGLHEGTMLLVALFTLGHLGYSFFSRGE